MAEVVAAPPERVEGTSLLRVHRVDVNAARAREDDLVRAGAESRHARIIPNLRLHVVAARLEEEGQPLRAEVAPGAVVEHPDRAAMVSLMLRSSGANTTTLSGKTGGFGCWCACVRCFFSGGGMVTAAATTARMDEFEMDSHAVLPISRMLATL